MSLFVYGTLMLPEIRYALLGKELKQIPAKLSGYSTYTFFRENHESEYPILKPEDNGIVNGYVLQKVTKRDYDILEYYEGEDYHLIEIDVEIYGRATRTNIFSNSNTKTFQYCKKWSLDDFLENHFNNYIEKVIPELLKEIT